MSRTFAYVRVSTIQQTIENQVQELETAGFSIPKRRIVSETISGSVPAQQRPMFARLVDRLEEGDVLVVTKMDRLGRDAMDVAQTVSLLAGMQVRVHCLALCQRRRKNRPRGGAKPGQWRGAKRHGARAPQIAGACHGALARRANLAGCDQVVASAFRARLCPSR